MNLKGKKVLVGMSGGVDSSVAAALLKGLGCEPAGMSINALSCDRGASAPCCSAEDREDARRVCETLGIPHFTLDMRAEFLREVADPFVAGYLAGFTPSPCVVCNEKIKFRGLLSEAERLRFDAVATGHYARVGSRGGRAVLLRAADEKKDQSYFLCRLESEVLSRVVFPLGSLTKEDVRRIAAEMELPTRAKRESQEACFVSNEGCAAFVEERAGEALPGPGFFVDSCGKR
ncbi:MAG TPA: asparagine synthase-related protein, partial [bacterium]|nr:asparagine synthase-related protein [bacterium]